MKARWLDRALFVSPFCYTLCASEAAFQREMRGLKIAGHKRPAWIPNDHSDAAAHWFKTPDGKTSAVVCIRLREGLSGIQVAAMLTHEAVHLWQWARKNYGEHEPSAELEAYAIQTYAQRLMEEFARQTGA